MPLTCFARFTQQQQHFTLSPAVLKSSTPWPARLESHQQVTRLRVIWHLQVIVGVFFNPSKSRGFANRTRAHSAETTAVEFNPFSDELCNSPGIS